MFFSFEKLSYRFPIFETSATALCGTTGIDLWWFIMIFYTYVRFMCNFTNTSRKFSNKDFDSLKTKLRNQI